METKIFGEVGKVSYDCEGKPICHICGKSFNRLMRHVNCAHNMTAREYKDEFGLIMGKGICSEKSRKKVSTKTLANFDTVIKQNLIEGGKKTRVGVGNTLRKNSKVSLEEKNRLRKQHLITNKEKELLVATKQTKENKK